MSRQVDISENDDGTFDVVYEQVVHQTDATYELAVQSALLLFGEDVEIAGSSFPAAASPAPAPVVPAEPVAAPAPPVAPPTDTPAPPVAPPA